ncbi:MAG: hypothetical protein K5761_04365 [Clostridiales bacterium]|nr:hypothetical protein [Clostridiales bacterium]
MDAYDLPEEFAHLQAQDMSKIGFINDVTRGIKKVIKPEENEPVIVSAPVIQNEAGNISALLERGFMALEDKEWQKADEFFEQALNFDAKNAKAYLGKLMVNCHASYEEDLAKTARDYSDNPNYNKVLRFGDPDMAARIEKYMQQSLALYQSEFRPAFENAVQRFNTLKTIEEFARLKNEFLSFGDYPDAKEWAMRCDERIEYIKTDQGILRIVFDSDVKESEFGIRVAGNDFRLGRVSGGRVLEYRLQSGQQTICFFNSSYTQPLRVDIRRDIVTTVHFRATWLEYKVWVEPWRN